MRVVAVLPRWCRFRRCRLRIHHEAPHAIVPGDSVRNALIYQPLEHAVHRDAVDRVVILDHPRDVQMRSRRSARQQARQHRDARLCEALAGGADGDFGRVKMIEICAFHGELHFTPG